MPQLPSKNYSKETKSHISRVKQVQDEKPAYHSASRYNTFSATAAASESRILARHEIKVYSKQAAAAGAAVGLAVAVPSDKALKQQAFVERLHKEQQVREGRKSKLMDKYSAEKDLTLQPLLGESQHQKKKRMELAQKA